MTHELFNNRSGILVTIRAMEAVIKRHNLQPDKDGNLQITFDMIAEAEALDRAAGEPEMVVTEENWRQ
jgi:hypothetical protein